MNKPEENESEILVHVSYDTFMRNISVHVHSDKVLTPRDFIEEISALVAEYQDNPELLFQDNGSELIDSQ